MASEDDIGFKIYAMIDGLKASMAEASSSVTKFSAEAKTQITGVGEAFASLNRFVLGFAAVVAGGIIFKDMIEGTEKWTQSIVSLAKQFGMTTEKASGLAVALKNIGSSTEEYQAAATKLDRQVKSNEEKINELGVTTRNANGDLLSQQEIMLNAISTLNQYKEGTDRNIAAQFMLGRGAGDLQHLLRLTSEEIARGADDAQRFGLVVGGDDYEATIKFQRAMSELNLAILGMERALGDKIIPALTEFAATFTNKIIPAIGAGIDKVKEFMDVLGKLYALVGTAGDPAVRDALMDNMAGIPYGKQAAAKTGGTMLGDQGSKTVPEGFGKSGGKDVQDAIDQEDANTQMELSKLVLAQKKEDLQTDFDNHKITLEQKTAALQDYTTLEYQEGMSVLDKEMSWYDEDTKEYHAALDKKAILTEQYNIAMDKITKDSAKEQAAEYKKMSDTINQTFDQMVNGVLQGTQTWQQAMARAFDNLALKFIDDFVVKSVIQMALSYAQQLGLTQTFHAAMRAIGLESATADAATQHGIQAAANVSTVTADAAVTFAGVFANQAPLLGPAAAIPAGAAEALVMAQIPQASLAVGAWSLPSDMTAQLHAGEMVVPKTFAEGMRDNGAGSTGSSEVHFHVSAIDAQSVASFFSNNGEYIAQAVNQQIRNGHPALAGSGLTTGRY